VSSFDLDEYKRQLDASLFESCRARLEARGGWELTMGAPGHYRATRLIDGRLHEIMLPALERLEIACQEYDEAVAVRAEIVAAEARDARRIAIQEDLDEALRRKVRQADWEAREVEAKRRRLEESV
jgi:hypothetical protein